MAVASLYSLLAKKQCPELDGKICAIYLLVFHQDWEGSSLLVVILFSETICQFLTLIRDGYITIIKTRITHVHFNFSMQNSANYDTHQNKYLPESYKPITCTEKLKLHMASLHLFSITLPIYSQIDWAQLTKYRAMLDFIAFILILWTFYCPVSL